MIFLTENRLRSIIIESIILESFAEDKEFLQRKYGKNDDELRAKITSLDPKQVRWLTMRWGLNPKFDKGNHQFSDCLDALISYKSREPAIAAKWKNNPAFIAAVDEFYTNEGLTKQWTSPTDNTMMSVEELLGLVGLSYAKESKVKVQADEAPPSIYIGKVGPWNLWLPKAMNDSIRICGFDPVTKKSHTTWCTCYIEGQNLFYNYNGAQKLLIYVIRDNPRPFPDPAGQFDYFSFGFKGGKLIAGGGGGTTIDRDNKGTSDRIWSQVFGEFKNDIFEMMYNAVRDSGGDSPSVEMPNIAMKDINILKQALVSLQKDKRIQEAHRIAKDAQKSHPWADECINYVAKFLELNSFVSSLDPMGSSHADDRDNAKIINLLLKNKTNIVNVNVNVIEKILYNYPIDIENINAFYGIIVTSYGGQYTSNESKIRVSDLFVNIRRGNVAQSNEFCAEFSKFKNPAEAYDAILMLARSTNPDDIQSALDETLLKDRLPEVVNIISSNFAMDAKIFKTLLDVSSNKDNDMKFAALSSNLMQQISKNENVGLAVNDLNFWNTLSVKASKSLTDMLCVERDFKLNKDVVRMIIKKANHSVRMTWNLTNLVTLQGLKNDQMIIDALGEFIDSFNESVRSKIAKILGINYRVEQSEQSEEEIDYDSLF